MKLAVMSLGGKTSLKIIEEAKKCFDAVDNIDIRFVQVHVNSKKKIEIFYNEKPLKNYDCVYIRGSSKYNLLQQSVATALYSKSYMPIHPSSYPVCHNKFLTVLELSKHNVSLPGTYIAATTKSAKQLLEKVNYPIILKIPSGTHGKGVLFADSIESAKSVLDTLEIFKQPYIIQEYIETNATDVRAIVAGDKVLGVMRRKASKQEIRANIHMGGSGLPYELDFDAEQVVLKAAGAVKAELCAVDLLETNKAYVLEVNVSPGLEGISTALNRNMAEDFAKFLYKKTKEFKDKEKKQDSTKVIDKTISPYSEQEILANLDVKAGIIKLPQLITNITKFKSDQEVKIRAKKGYLQIEKNILEEE